MIQMKSLRSMGARLLTSAAVCTALLLTGCEVKNPGAILDEDLNDELVLQALVTGMSSDFSVFFDGLAFDMARGSDEMTGSGSYFETGLLRRGIINREDQNFEWGGPHRARWVAEAGLLRMDSILGPKYSGHPLVARAFLFATMAYRVLGECLCYAVIDSSGVMPRTAYFDSLLVRADSAIFHAQAAGETDIVTAAHGLKAQAWMGLGNWTNAVTEAGMVPTDFVFEAVYSDNSGREENEIYNETHGRAEMSAFGMLAGTFSPPDPRAPYTDCSVSPIPTGCNSQQGADGSTAHYQQEKYPELGTNIPVVKGTGMRLIEAEARLVADDAAGGVQKINEARNFYGLPDTTAADINAAWILLDDERNLTLWMEARRWWDLTRWDAAGRSFMPGVQFLNGQTSVIYQKDASVPKRRACIPISLAECQTNPNVKDAAECQGSFYP